MQTRLRIACLSLALIAISPLFAQPPAQREFGRGAPFDLEELPKGQLKDKVKKLKPQARAEALKRLHTFSFPESDAAKFLRVDDHGDTFQTATAWAQSPVDASNLTVGKHVGEDPNTTRADETLGYIVMESGTGVIDGIAFEAALGGKSVRGFGNSTSAYTYTLSGNLNSTSVAAVSMSGMSGTDGAWAVLSGSPAFTSDSIGLHACEDKLKDSEQGHVAEHAGYIVFE